MIITESIKRLKWYETLLWVTCMAAILISFFLFSERNIYTLIASLIGVTALIFVAKGDVLGNDLYGFINWQKMKHRQCS